MNNTLEETCTYRFERRYSMRLTTDSRTLQLDERTHIMGILNVTPDSFSDGGSYTTVKRAVKQAVLMEAQGADIIDIGGESTRPDHEAVSQDEEIDRGLQFTLARTRDRKHQ